MRYTAALFLALVCSFGLDAAVSKDTSAFVEIVRSMRGSTYASLNGLLQHRRSGKPAQSMPIYVGLIIQPERTTGQIILDAVEGYCHIFEKHLHPADAKIACEIMRTKCR